jgi:arylsulfatase A-like enzyme
LARQPNVLLVTVDCLRADHLGCYGYPRATTPAIDGLAEGATLYARHYANGANTPNSFPALMCSRHRMESPQQSMERRWDSIATILADSGYDTVGLVSSNPFISRFYRYDRGFARFEDHLGSQRATFHGTRLGKGGKEGLVQRAYEVLIYDSMGPKRDEDRDFAARARRELQALRDGEGPWFCWMHYMDTHHVYAPSDLPFSSRRASLPLYPKLLNYAVGKGIHLGERMRGDVVDIYDAAVRQVDGQVASLLDALRPVMDDTLLVLTADHGEAFLERGEWGHPWHGVHDECLRVPLIVRYPGQEEGERVTRPTSHVDILPTVVDVADAYLPPIVRGCPPTSSWARGASRPPSPRSGPSHWATTGRWWTGGGTGSPSSTWRRTPGRRRTSPARRGSC